MSINISENSLICPDTKEIRPSFSKKIPRLQRAKLRIRIRACLASKRIEKFEEDAPARLPRSALNTRSLNATRVRGAVRRAAAFKVTR